MGGVPQRKDVSGESTLREQICQSSLMLNSSSMPKATINNLMNTQDVYHFSSFSAIVYWRGEFITKCSDSEK